MLLFVGICVVNTPGCEEEFESAGEGLQSGLYKYLKTKLVFLCRVRPTSTPLEMSSLAVEDRARSDPLLGLGLDCCYPAEVISCGLN